MSHTPIVPSLSLSLADEHEARLEIGNNLVHWARLGRESLRVHRETLLRGLGYSSDALAKVEIAIHVLIVSV